MAYGIQLFNDNGTIMWDSTTTGSGVIVDILNIPANTGPTIKSYPGFAGRTLVVVGMLVSVSSDATNYTISYDQGYPSVTFPSVAYTRTRFIIIIR